MVKKVSLKVVLAAVLITFVFLAGCVSSQQSPDPNSQQPPDSESQQQSEAGKQEPGPGKSEAKKVADYFPLTKGSSWEYEGEGNEYASFVTKVLYTKGNRAQTSQDNGGTVSATVFQVTDDLVAKVFFQGEAYDAPNYLDQQPNQKVVILKAPLEVGTKWETPEGTREIVDDDAVVETPAGKFENCIKVKITNPDSVLYEYYKEGVGLVKREFISGDTRVTSTLKKYDIK